MVAVVCAAVPNVLALIAAHSPLASGLRRSQSGMKLVFASVQVRVVVRGDAW